MYDVEYKTYIKKLTQNGYKKVNIPEIEEKIIEIYVNKNGNVKSLRLFENGYKIKDVKLSEVKNGYLKYNIYTTDKQCKCRMLAQDIYNTFNYTNCSNNDIYYLDDNKKNCNIDNLVSVNTLIEFYKEKNNI